MFSGFVKRFSFFGALTFEKGAENVQSSVLRYRDKNVKVYLPLFHIEVFGSIYSTKCNERNCEMNYELDAVKERCEKAAIYIIEERATVRAAARKFGISKSTVHKDVTERLEKVNAALYQKVTEVLSVNKKERHLRGGEATRKKYLKLREEK